MRWNSILEGTNDCFISGAWCHNKSSTPGWPHRNPILSWGAGATPWPLWCICDFGREKQWPTEKILKWSILKYSNLYCTSQLHNINLTPSIPSTIPLTCAYVFSISSLLRLWCKAIAAVTPNWGRGRTVPLKCFCLSGDFLQQLTLGSDILCCLHGWHDSTRDGWQWASAGA